jgi:N-acyl-D-amino-acid deacylase
MFQSTQFAQLLGVEPPAGPREIIRVMSGKPLDFAPGERYAYSNYGYCLLGRVIETVSGIGYEQYVQQEVLAPLGIEDMRLGKTRSTDRLPCEVCYYDPGQGPCVFADALAQTVPSPYGAWCLEAMDAHGGWLASVVDLARFAAALDCPEACPILKPETIREMHRRPPGIAGHDASGTPKDVYYSMGWLNRSMADGARVNHWHTGSLPGTSAILIRRHDGRNFVALLNSRVSPTASRLSRVLDPSLHRAANQVHRWPEIDLFPEFGLKRSK